MSLRDKALDYRKLSAVKPTYRMARIVQQTGGTSVTLSATAPSESIFDLPSRCRSLSRSFLYFDLVVPETDTSYNHVWTQGCPFFERVEFGARGGTRIVELNHANVYYKATSAYTKKLSDMLQADTVNGRAVVTAGRQTSMNSMVCRNNSTASATAVAGGNNPNRVVDVAGTITQVINSLNDTEPQYSCAGILGAGTQEGKTIINVALPLSEFKGTYLSLPQDSYFPEVMELKLIWAQTTKLGFVAPLTGATGANNLALPLIENLYFYDAIEVDQDICKQLMAKVSSGMSQVIPYVYTHREAFTSVSSFNQNRKYSGAQGQRLLRVLHCNVHQTESGATFGMLDNNTEANGNGAEIISFNTNLDSLRLQEIDVRSGQHGEDYALMKHQIDGSCVQNRSVYNHLRIWSDSFDGQRLSETDELDDVQNGLPMTGVERTWSLSQTHNGSISGVNYVFAVFQRTLSQSGGQIIIQ